MKLLTKQDREAALAWAQATDTPGNEASIMTREQQVAALRTIEAMAKLLRSRVLCGCPACEAGMPISGCTGVARMLDAVDGGS